MPRQGKSYLTVRNPDDGKRWRLKGALYEHDFEPRRLGLAAPAPVGGRAARDGERTAAHELKLLESLRGVARNALHTIEADTAAWTGRIRGTLLRAWVRPLVIGLSLSVGICGGSWAAMRLLWTAIEWKVETLAALTVDTEEARQIPGHLIENNAPVGLDVAKFPEPEPFRAVPPLGRPRRRRSRT